MWRGSVKFLQSTAEAISELRWNKLLGEMCRLDKCGGRLFLYKLRIWNLLAEFVTFQLWLQKRSMIWYSMDLLSGNCCLLGAVQRITPLFWAGFNGSPLKCADVLCCVMSPETRVLKQHFSALSYRIIQKLSSRAPAREGELQWGEQDREGRCRECRKGREGRAALWRPMARKEKASKPDRWERQ